jgi:hypothetical protein
MMTDVTFERTTPNRRMVRLMENLPGEMRASFSDAQRAALSDALNSRTWRRQSVDIRLSFPLLANRYFMTIEAGRERRPGLRRKAERVFHPLGTIGNTLFMGAITTLICSVILVIALVYSSILEP